jgi:hypothetical protein
VATSGNQAALDLWRGPYPGILRCNLVLQQLPQSPLLFYSCKDIRRCTLTDRTP